MKKIIISLAIVAAISAIAYGATTAYFSDTETSTGNTFTAGTLDLKLTDSDESVQDSVTASFGGTNLKPGDVLSQQSITVTNSGTIDANHLDLEITLPVGNNSDLANALVFPYTPDSANGMRFGLTTSAGDSVNMLTYLRGTYNDGDYDLYRADGTSIYGALAGDDEISLQDIVGLGKIRIVADSNSEGLVAGTSATLWIHPIVDTDLTTQGETVDATFTFTLDQNSSQQ